MGKEKNASQSVITPRFTLSFPNLEKAESIMGSKDKFFSIQMLFAKEGNHDWVQNILKNLYKEKWGDVKRPSTFKSPWHDGDVKAEDSGKEGYVGYYFMNAKAGENNKILFLDGLKKEIPAAVFYAGCTCVAKLEFSTYDNQFGKGISCWLRGLQFVADGEPLSGGAMAKADEFETVEGAKAKTEMSDDDF